MDGRDGTGHIPAPAYDALSFGRYLKAIRMEKGIAMEAVVSETRIPGSVLSSLEAEDHDTLPDEVYVKGFLRSYAQILDVNADIIIRRYEADCRLHRRAARYRADLIRSGRRFWSWITLSVTAFACLILVSAVVLMVPDLAKEAPRRDKPALPPPVQHKAAPQRPQQAGLAPKHHLTVTAMAETWIKVIIDGQMPRKYPLKPGDQLELTATRDFNLLIGNAGSVTLMFDHMPLPVPGKTGQTVTLWLPRRHGR
jgi:cytoskeleton protein RodZ